MYQGGSYATVLTGTLAGKQELISGKMMVLEDTIEMLYCLISPMGQYTISLFFAKAS